MKKLLLVMIASASFAVSAETFECRLVGGVPSALILSKMNIQSNEKNSVVTFASNKGPMIFNNVECKEDHVPEAVLSCEHDHFVALVDLEEKITKAVVNPFVYEGKEHGPYFYLCSKNKN